jgi:HupE / UreJ protein
VDGDHVEVQMRLTPGVEVFDRVLAAIDANRDGVISEAEQQAYAEHVSRDLSLKIDGYPLQIRLVSSTFPKLEEIKEGLGDILLNIEAHLPKGGLNRRLTFENHHLNAISVYLVNCLIPSDPNIHVTALGAAFFFGLFHGLGFAGGLLEAMREMQTGTMLLAILAFSIGVEFGYQMVVLPLFGFLKAARHSQPDAGRRTHLSMAFQRIDRVGGDFPSRCLLPLLGPYR